MDSAASIPNAVAIAVLLALLVSGLGWWRGWLSGSGFWAAAMVGSAVFAGGIPLTVGLLFFFFAAGVMGRLIQRHDDSQTSDQHKPRTAAQVLAVGLCPAASAVAYAITQHPVYVMSGLSALAFATADTWATDMGMSSDVRPRMLGFGNYVAPGMSGGMTLRGTLGSLMGATALAGISILSWPLLNVWLATGMVVIGFGGALLDSLLGATVQQRMQCERCGATTENTEHCGLATKQVYGWLSNSGVNAVCSWCAGLVGWIWGA